MFGRYLPPKLMRADETKKARGEMDFKLTDEQRLISETAREFADKEITPRVKENDRAARFDRELASKLGEVGYLGAPVSETYRGRAPPRPARGPRRGRAGRRLAGEVGHGGAEAEVAAPPLLGRGAGLLRPDRA